MKRGTMLLYGILALGLIALLAGCGNDDKALSPETDSAPELARIIPQDGASGVEPQSSIHLKFTMPMDTGSVRENFFLTGGPRMHEWMDSANYYGGFDHMGMNQRNHMMEWIDSIHVAGEFRWNEPMDSCEFMPALSMDQGAEYMILMYEDGMMDRDGRQMDMGQGNDGYHSYHFTTQPPPSGTPNIIRMWPANSESNVPVQSSIHLVFDMPMDTASVAENFHFSGGMEMEEWMDSLEQQSGMGGMGMMDMDHMMGWMDDIEHSGNFNWNNSLDSCEFIPDSTMMHNTEYMLFINGEVYGRNGMKMDFELFDDDAFQHHFRTKP